jgi:metallo-beta-lactamase class B
MIHNKLTRLIVLLFLLIPAIKSNCQAYREISITPDLKLVRISDNVLLHVSFTNSAVSGRYSSNGLVFISQGEALLFDTPTDDALTESLVSFLRDSMKLKIKVFVPNHFHEDCMGGLGYIHKAGIASYAGEKTIAMAKKNGLPVPEHGFKDSLRLKVGNESVLCYYPGPAHTRDNIVVWITSEKILFAGCMCKSIDAVDLGNLADANVQEYAGTIGKVIDKFDSARVVVPGHGNIGDFSLLLHTKQLADDAAKLNQGN